VSSNENVLVVWGGGTSPDNIQQTVTSLQKQTKSVAVENIHQLKSSSLVASTFDVILCGVIPPHCIDLSVDSLGEMLRILKPRGSLYINTVTSQDNASPHHLPTLISHLKLAGFSQLSEAKALTVDLEAVKKQLPGTDVESIVTLSAKKPDFEVGSSAALSFAKPAAPVTNGKSVWVLSAEDTMDDDIDIIDPDTLISQDDFNKPDPKSLRVCGTTGKRKACKDCSCGLAEELGAGAEITTKTPTQASSCGSCYLGDAFRCASCPYLGMPAFKPGEKVKISDTQLKPDI